MAIATLLGVLVGLFFGEHAKIFAPWGSAYIMVLKITAVPYLIGAIMHGIGQLGTLQAKQILKKGPFFILLAWVINIVVIYLTYLVFPQPKVSPALSYIANPPTSINFAELLIPENIFAALSNNILPAVVVFSVLIGISLMYMKEKTAIMSTLETLVQALTRITSWISRITPIGTFIIMANQVGTVEISTLKQMSTYLILFILSTCLIVFWVCPRLISTLTPIRALAWLRYSIPFLLLAYTTNVVIVCLPYIIELIHRETALIHPHDEKAQTQVQGIVSIIFNLPLGSLFITVFIFFISLFFNSPLHLGQQIQLFATSFLTSLGSVGLGAWINSLTFLLDTLALPLDAIELYLTTLPFTAGFQSMLSAMEIATFGLFITLACRRPIKWRWHKVLISSVITAAPIFLIFGAIKFYNPLPKIENISKTIYDLNIPTNIPITTYTTTNAPAPIAPSSKESSFDRILRTKVLRVGYNPNATPFCFYNKEKKLVGYDMAFAYALAEDLGCRLELILMQYGNVIQEIGQGRYDIAMSALSINEERLREITFTSPYVDSPIIFVVQDHRRQEFTSLGKVLANPHLKIAVLKGSSFEKRAEELFSKEQIVPLDHLDAFTEKGVADALLWQETEAIAWVLRHPHFLIVKTEPGLGTDSLAYAIQANDQRFLNFLNIWLKLKRNEGFTEKQYNTWVLGKTAKPAKEEPRWSILHNVLHWSR